MNKLLTATLSAVIVFGFVGCKSTPKTATTPEPRTLDNAPNRLGKGIEGAAQGPINAVKTGANAIGNALGGDKDKGKSEHPDHPKKDNSGNSEHPDHPDS